MSLKVIVTIPAYNEEGSIGKVIRSIPKKIAGISKLEILVLDDGSSDRTVIEAKKAGAKYIYSNKANLGLASTFNKAIQKAMSLGADIIVNTDADNQYNQKEIPLLLKPIIEGKADMVTGNRQITKLNHMPFSKKYGNVIGSWTIRLLTGCTVSDASSGFRAFTKECAQSFNLLSKHTYTHETIIQAINNNFLISEVPITFNKRVSGNSRLISGLYPHVKKSLSTIVRTILMYKAFKYLVTTGLFILLLGVFGGIRFLYFYLNGNGSGHIQSLVFSSILISIGFTTIQMGIIADLIAINRQLLEKSK